MTQATCWKSIVWTTIACFSSLTVYGDEVLAPTQVDSAPSATEATHAAIRSLRDALIKATNEKDIDTLTSLIHEDVVLTAQDGDKLVAVRKRAGVRAYLQKMLTGPEAGVLSMTVNPVVDELTILHGGDTGVAFGSSSDHYVLRDGMEFDLETRWSATLVLVDGNWQIANLQVSSNLFDNPITRAMSKLTLYVGLGAALLGLLCGSLATFLVRKRCHTAPVRQ